MTGIKSTLAIDRPAFVVFALFLLWSMAVFRLGLLGGTIGIFRFFHENGTLLLALGFIAAFFTALGWAFFLLFVLLAATALFASKDHRRFGWGVATIAGGALVAALAGIGISPALPANASWLLGHILIAAGLAFLVGASRHHGEEENG